MQTAHLTEQYQGDVLKKWAPVINGGASKIKDRRTLLNTALVMESTEAASASQTRQQRLNEAWTTGSMSAGPGAVSGSTPIGGGALGATDDLGIGDSRIPSVIVPMLRRVFPALIAHETMSVQPMATSISRAYALRLLYGDNAGGVTAPGTGIEAGYNTLVPGHSGNAGAEDRSGNYNIEDLDADGDKISGIDTTGDGAEDLLTTDEVAFGRPLDATAAAGLNDQTFLSSYQGTNDFTGQGAALGASEYWTVGTDMPMLAMKIVSGVVEAKTRKLAATWSNEVAEDMLNMQGIDINAEMVNGLSNQVGQDIDRQCLTEMNSAAIAGKLGRTKSVWNAALSDGRNQNERIGTLFTQVLLAARKIAINTRVGAGNFAIADNTVTSLLERVGEFGLDGSAAGIDGKAGISRAGTLRQGKIKLFTDTFGGDFINGRGYVMLGYKGTDKYDSGIAYCPYVPIELTSIAAAHDDFNPRVGVRTRYGMLDSLQGASNYYHYVMVEGLNDSTAGDDGRTFLF